jgi:hypothetical protein
VYEQVFASVKCGPCRVTQPPASDLGEDGGEPVGWSLMSKKTKKKKARLRRSKANHGKRPNMGR